MNKSILITGVAGSGKSAICDELNNLSYKAYDIENMEGLFTMINKKTGKAFKGYNNDNIESVKQSDWICGKNKLKQLIKKNSKGIVFYCGVASNLDDLLFLFDKIFLLKVDQKALRKRLSTRTSNDFGRTSEVQRWIFSWKQWWEEDMIKKGAIVMSANCPLREIAINIIKKSKSSK